MGQIWVALFSFFIFLSATAAISENIVLKKMVTEQELVAEFCRIESLSSRNDRCGFSSYITSIDVLRLPYSLAAKIAAHVESAFAKKYYFNLDKQDFFHGHFLNRGPQTTYMSPQEYFADVRLVLYHSQEYLPHAWEAIEGFDPFVPHKNQRSFVGGMGEDLSVIPAIDLIDRSLYLPPYDVSTLRSYRNAGTIYTWELNQSVKESLHEHKGNHLSLYMWTSEAAEKKCEIFEQIYILEDASGRFVSPDGKRYDMTMHCRYYRK